MVNFGHELKEFFIMDGSYVNVSSGYITPVLKDSYYKSKYYRDIFIKNPYAFYEDKFQDLLLENRQSLAELFQTSARNIAFTRSSEDSLNSILRSFTFLMHDDILTSINISKVTSNILEYVCNKVGARHIKLNIPIEGIGKSDIVQFFEDSFTINTRLVILEEVCSTTSKINPICPIIRMCKDLGINVLIDGTYFTGYKNRNLDELGADWYVGSCNKWLSSDMSVGYIWSSDKCSNIIKPNIINEFSDYVYPDNFSCMPISDYSVMLSVKTAIDFRKNLGSEEDISNYCHSLVIKGANLIAENFDIDYVVPNSFISFMTLVKLPDYFQNETITVDYIISELFKKKIIANIFLLRNTKYVRLSANVFNELSDYQDFSDVLSELQV